MSQLEFRPRFKFRTPISIEDIVQKLSDRIATENEHGLMIKKVHDHIVLDFPASDRHSWTPHMDINLEKEEKIGMTMVRCLIGPSPTIWTMFMFFYGLFGFLSFVGLTLGMSQWTLKKPMWGFWALPIAIIGVLAMYFISFEGKKLSRDEMRILKKFLDDSLGCDCFQMAIEGEPDY